VKGIMPNQKMTRTTCLKEEIDSGFSHAKKFYWSHYMPKEDFDFFLIFMEVFAFITGQTVYGPPARETYRCLMAD
jgi:hypothetical protein